MWQSIMGRTDTTYLQGYEFPFSLRGARRTYSLVPVATPRDSLRRVEGEAMVTKAGIELTTFGV